MASVGGFIVTICDVVVTEPTTGGVHHGRSIITAQHSQISTPLTAAIISPVGDMA